VDSQPDAPEDFEENPIAPEAVMKVGQHKGKTVAEVYRQDKDYLKWVRSHIDQKSTGDMQKLRVFIEFTDVRKRNRINQKQMPVAPSKSKIRPRPSEEWEMDWQQVPGHEKEKQILEKWERLTMRASEVEKKKKQQMVSRVAQHPNALAIMSLVMET
jgi:hypothetical protein